MKLEIYLREAWERGITTVFPGIGALKPVRLPACVHPVTHTFSPPHLTIQVLATGADEGPFQHFLSERLHTGLPEAKQAMQQCMQQWQQQLQTEGQAVVDGLGRLVRNAGDHVELKLEGLLVPTEAYGLPQFTCPPLTEVAHAHWQPSVAVQPKAVRRLFWIRL